jgi:hypothetical protein
VLHRNHCCCRHDEDIGVGWILLAMLGLAITFIAFWVVVVSAHIWLLATILMRVCEGIYVRAVVWSCILAWLVYIDLH